MITVRNRKSFNKSGVYVGRPSPFGNPWPVDEKNSREKVVEQYRSWLHEKMKNPNSIQYRSIMEMAKAERNGEVINLICWCAPLACHADVIKECIESIATTGRWEI